ncbi:MAG: phosphatidylserine decarboxylase [Propionibacteriaceae bacterium]|jgi:phosphatidylserine decarboxylase|nr:phosphatidylserine decarboxylase [Propionibacteriaceae bacterium]
MAQDPRRPSSGPTHLIRSIVHAVPKIHPAGRGPILAGLTVALFGLRWRPLRWAGLAWAGAMAAFFRQPERVTPSQSGLVLAPADGEVCLVDRAVPPAELELGSEPLPHVSVFLSILDVHVQRAPLTGSVTRLEHRPGRFLAADLPEASQDNERNSMVLTDPAGRAVGVVQIAGLVARRIVCQAEVGDILRAGQVYGLIRFGSRVDLYLPLGSSLAVLVGQRAVGGETVIGRLP